MAVLRAKDAAKMNRKAREEKIAQLKLELTKANVAANKANAKTKEIKRGIARLLTLNNLEKKAGKPNTETESRRLKNN